MRLLVASLVGLLALSGCGSDSRGRVLLVAIDGTSPRVTGPWIERGLLPNLARLTEDGSSGDLRSRWPFLSPRVWTSIATGMLPVKHGIAGWVRKEKDGTPRLITGADRKTPALWNIVSAAGLSVGVVNWLDTHPPEKINGVMITDFAIPGQRKSRYGLGMGMARRAFGRELAADDPNESGAVVTYPVDWIRNVREQAENGKPLLDVPNPFVDNVPLPNRFNHRMLARTFRNDDLIVRLALEVNEQIRPDILMVLLQGIDRVSHFFWGAFEPSDAYPENLRFSKEGKRAALEAMQTYYRYTDQLIGRIIDEFGPDDLVLVVSDHGFEVATNLGNNMTGGHDSEAAEMGVIFARGPGVEAGGELLGIEIHDITPTILAWLGLPVAEDMDGQLAPFVQSAQSVASYKTVRVERVGEIPSGTEGAIIEDLRALGYVE